MDHSTCCVVYCDDRVRTERLVKRDAVAASATGQQQGSIPGYFDLLEEPYELQSNVKAILGVFSSGKSRRTTTRILFSPTLLKSLHPFYHTGPMLTMDHAVYLCASGKSFSTKLAEYNEICTPNCTPIFALFDIQLDARSDNFMPNPLRNVASHDVSATPMSLMGGIGGIRRELTFSSESDESYGLQLLSRISSDIQVQDGPSVIIPIAVLRSQVSSIGSGHGRGQSVSSAFYESNKSTSSIGEEDTVAIDPKKMLRCLDAGATDVLPAPLEKVRIMGLTVHAYRVFKTATKEQSRFLTTRRHRKQSWVGVDDHKPYAYLREAMVSKLMKGICNPEDVIEDFQEREVVVEEERKPIIRAAIGKWAFCAHDFNDDELVYGAYCMLDHSLKLDELKKWRMSAGKESRP